MLPHKLDISREQYISVANKVFIPDDRIQENKLNFISSEMVKIIIIAFLLQGCKSDPFLFKLFVHDCVIFFTQNVQI